MGLKIVHKGSFRKAENFLYRVLKDDLYFRLDKYGQAGARALASATPSVSGETAASWDYYIHRSRERSSITWVNNHIAGTTPVVILLQYGHATGTGGYVRGYDFINPALRSIFDDIADQVWQEVVNA